MNSVRYSQSAVRTLAGALTAADDHAWAITDTATGTVKGVYGSESLAATAVMRLVGTPGLFVMTIVHPSRCDCPEMA